MWLWICFTVCGFFLVLFPVGYLHRVRFTCRLCRISTRQEEEGSGLIFPCRIQILKYEAIAIISRVMEDVSLLKPYCLLHFAGELLVRSRIDFLIKGAYWSVTKLNWIVSRYVWISSPLVSSMLFLTRHSTLQTEISGSVEHRPADYDSVRVV